MIAVALAIASVLAADTFRGAQCTDDCSGHRAGYAWAAAKGLTDPMQCAGKSASFTKGCVIYALEHSPPLGRFCGSGSDECASVCEAAEALESAADDLTNCARRRDLADDCWRQFRDVRSAHSDYESAVSDTGGECE